MRKRLNLGELLSALHDVAVGTAVDIQENGYKCPNCGTISTFYRIRRNPPDRIALQYLIDYILTGKLPPIPIHLLEDIVRNVPDE